MDTTILEKLVREQFAHLDAGDFAGVLTTMSKDCQLVDEVTGRWVRGTAAIGDYFDELGREFAEISSTVDDMVARDMGEYGLVTCMVEQTYRRDGATLSSAAPVSVVFARSGGHWEAILVHAVALPQAG